MFNRRPSSSQQHHADAFHQLADRVGRAGPIAASTSTSGGYGFTNQLAHVDHLSRHPHHPSNGGGRNGNGNGHSAYSRRRSVDIFRDFTPAGGDYPVRVEKRSNAAAARRGPRVVPIDPAVWEIDEGLKAAWRAHLDATHAAQHVQRREEEGSAMAA